MHQQILSLLPNAKILYGGSVKAANASEIMDVAGVSGVLVGGASLQVDEFLGIIGMTR
jgi:triosephosphate isomerase